MDKKICRTCGSEVNETNRFCNQCGGQTFRTADEDIATSMTETFTLENTAPLTPSPEQTPVVPKKEDSSKPIIIAIGVVALIAIITVIIIAAILGNRSASDEATNEPTIQQTTKPVAPKETPDVSKPEEDEPSAEPEEPEDDALIAGSVSGNTYINEYLGIRCTLDNWKFMSEEEIAEATNISKDMLSSNEDMTEFIDSGKTVTLMLATNPNGFPNTNINITDVGNTLLSSMTLDEEAVYQELQKVIMAELESTDISAENFEIKTLPTANGTRTALTYQMSIGGATVYQVQTYILKDNYSSCVTVSALTASEAEDVFQYYTFE